MKIRRVVLEVVMLLSSTLLAAGLFYFGSLWFSDLHASSNSEQPEQAQIAASTSERKKTIRSNPLQDVNPALEGEDASMMDILFQIRSVLEEIIRSRPASQAAQQAKTVLARLDSQTEGFQQFDQAEQALHSQQLENGQHVLQKIREQFPDTHLGRCSAEILGKLDAMEQQGNK